MTNRQPSFDMIFNRNAKGQVIPLVKLETKPGSTPIWEFASPKR